MLFHKRSDLCVPIYFCHTSEYSTEFSACVQYFKKWFIYRSMITWLTFKFNSIFKLWTHWFCVWIIIIIIIRGIDAWPNSFLPLNIATKWFRNMSSVHLGSSCKQFEKTCERLRFWKRKRRSAVWQLCGRYCFLMQSTPFTKAVQTKEQLTSREIAKYCYKTTGIQGNVCRDVFHMFVDRLRGNCRERRWHADVVWTRWAHDIDVETQCKQNKTNRSEANYK